MNYKIIGEPFPVVLCDLQAGEEMICESGSMAWMTPNMRMETTGGGVGKMFGRMLSGESLFQNRYIAEGGPGQIAFASSFPGSIRAVEVTPNKGIILQKSAFLAATNGVNLATHFQKKLGAGLVGGEGFIMQRVSGSGMVFFEIDGYAAEYELAPGQQMVLDTGYLAAMDETCSIDVKTVPGLKNMFLGGEGAFNTVVTGPGRIIIQTAPVSNLAMAIRPYIQSAGSN